VFRLIQSINEQSENIKETRVKEIFEKWWPDLEDALKNVPVFSETSKPADNGKSSKRGIDEKIDELLELVRNTQRRTTTLQSSWISRSEKIDSAPDTNIFEVTIYFTVEDSKSEAEISRERIDKVARRIPHWSKIVEDDEGHHINVRFDPPVAKSKFDQIIQVLVSEGRRFASYRFTEN
jgi:hypothetical protein